jgi:hypothetical protein
MTLKRMVRRMRKWMAGRDRYSNAVGRVGARRLGIYLARAIGLSGEGVRLAQRLARHDRRLRALRLR